MKKFMSLIFAASATLIALTTANAQKATTSSCQNVPSESQLRQLLVQAQNLNKPIGGLFEGVRMWAAVVNRDGSVCPYNTSTGDPTQVWPGSQAIAKSKAYTANAFSLDTLALSTALLYTFAKPGHSLFGLNNSNPFDPLSLAPPGGQGGGKNQIVGGIITFGGGVPLYANG